MEENSIPDADAFRQWVEAVLKVLEIKAYALSMQCGVPVNSVKKFVSGAQQNINLDTANKLAEGCHRLAREDGKSLPPLPITSNEEGEADQ